MTKQKWTVDKDHSEIKFKVKHMKITNVTGSFNDFDVQVETEDEDFSNAEISFSAKASSIDTDNEKRDEHLKSEDFFDAENHPEIKFKASGYEKTGDDSFKLKGDLTMKGKTNEVTLNGEFGGVGKDPWGNTKAGFSLEGKIDRTDFGLNWNQALESGGVLVSKEVKIMAEVQLAKKDD